jgi:hypothetical protein
VRLSGLNHFTCQPMTKRADESHRARACSPAERLA